MDLKSFQLIIFDLDGTVYEDTHHFKYYAQKIKEKLPIPLQTNFQDDYNRSQKLEHPLRIGAIYDVKRDWVLVHRNRRVIRATDWQGQTIPDGEVQSAYPGPVEIDMERMISIGDPWWLPSSIGRHYGLTGEDTFKAFMETREYMMTDEFQMNPVPGLKEALEQANAKLVLVTNSPEQDSRAILGKLDLLNSFDELVFQAQKPTKTAEVFMRLMNKYGTSPAQSLSIGDNGINEIYPAIEMGMHAIFIDQNDLAKPGDADLIVDSIGEVVKLLQAAQ
jgi:HAD superfamily hydrolase (TIGR01509 family)